MPGTASNYQGPAVDKDEHDQVLFRADQNIGTRVRLSFRYSWLDSYEVLSPSAIEIQPVWQPRVNKNWLGSYTHSLGSNLHNDFRIGYHRMDVDTLNYFWVNGIEGAGSALGIPGFDADVAFENHGIPNFGISAFSGLGQGGTNWHQYDTTFQLSDVLSYTRGSHNLRAGFDARRMATWRQSGNQPRGEFNFTGDMSGYSMADFMLGRAAERRDDRLDGHGSRGKLAEWLLRERRVATDVEDDAQPRPALRAEYGGADLRRLRLGTERGLHANHPVVEPGGLPGARIQAARAEPRRHRAAARRDLPADRQDGAPRRLGYLLQPEPDEHVHVSDEQPAARPAVHL